MLRKLISIKNVGHFLSYGASGDVDCKRYTLVLAESGRGKTTLCAILRSLQTGNPRVSVCRTDVEPDTLTQFGVQDKGQRRRS